MKELEEELKSLRKENEKYKNASLNNNSGTNKQSANINNNQKLTKVQQISESEKEEDLYNDVDNKNIPIYSYNNESEIENMYQLMVVWETI